MDHEKYLAHIVEQAEALKAAAVAAGPAAAVPTCPEWTVKDLVEHVAVVHALVCEALKRSPDDERPPLPPPPEDWTALLAWWDGKRAEMTTALGAAAPDTPAWSFIPGMGSYGWWARRQAHETAIHRLDAEHVRTDDVPPLLFDSELAADGIDEVVALITPFRAKAKRPEVTVEGTLLVHAADAGRAWLLHAEGGEVRTEPVRDAAQGSGTDADATLAGTADAVYRAAWKRPSHAILTGRAELVHAINGG